MRGIIQNAPFGVFLAMVGFPLAMAGVTIFAGIKGRQMAKLVKETKAAALGMAADGYHQFEGRAEAIGGTPLRAPLTGVECVWYSARLEEWRRTPGDRHKSDWHEVREITSSVPVLVRDATGAAVIYPSGAEVTPTDKSRWTGAGPEPDDRNPPRLGPGDSFEAGLQISGGPNSKFRYTESRIYAGDPLLVMGLYNSGRFTAAGDEDEDDEDGASAADLAVDQADDDARHVELGPWVKADSDWYDALEPVARKVTKASVMSGGRGQPLVMAATTAATHAAMNDLGSKAAFTIALLPLAIAVLVVLARFG